MKNLIIKNLSFAFKANTKALFNNLNAQFSAGRVYFICGKNGSGKSTLFRIIQGHVHHDEQLEGSITLDGNTRHTDYVRMVQQDNKTMIAAHSSFVCNAQLAAMPYHPKLRSLPTANLFQDLIEQFDINITTPAHLLSGGQRQILAIVMTLQKPTQILLLDEPTSALDEGNAKLVMEFLQLLTNKLGLITLIICHDKELVNMYAQDGYYELKQHSDGSKNLVYSKLSF